MRAQILAAIAAAAVAASSGSASAQTATATTTGTFTTVYLGPQDTSPIYSGLGTNTLRFGAPEPSWTITYTGASTAYSTSPFYLGALTVYNGSVFSDSAISGTNLHLETQIDPAINPGGDGLGVRDEMITILSRLNTDDPIASADELGFASLSLGANVFEGATATFLLFGTVNSPLTITDIQLAPGSENAGFVAPFEGVSFALTPAVPEPATWAMMLIGFGAIGQQMRRKRKAAQFA